MAENTTTADEVIGMRAVTAMCGTTAKTIYEWLRRRAFPAPMRAVPRGRLRWRRSTIEEWLASSTVNAHPEQADNGQGVSA
jgi:predicted DNA-binding transcriptional regulator AlpA